MVERSKVCRSRQQNDAPASASPLPMPAGTFDNYYGKQK